MYPNIRLLRFRACHSDPEPTLRSGAATEKEGKTGEATSTRETPGPNAQGIGALDEDKSENLSPVEEHDEVEITGAF